MTTQVQSAKTQQGFSLIELLVVVAIIGVLAAAGVVGYTSYLDNVKADTHKNNVVTLGKALQLTAVAANGGLKQPYPECEASQVNIDNDGPKAQQMLECVSQIAETNKFKSPYPVSASYVVASPASTETVTASTTSSSACTNTVQGKIVVHHQYTNSAATGSRMPTILFACGFPKAGESAKIVEGSFISVDYLN